MNVENDAANNRFFANVEGGEAILTYKLTPPGVMDLRSVEVPKEARGKGIADLLVQAALKLAKDKGFKIIPTCPYVKKWFEKHPQETTLLR